IELSEILLERFKIGYLNYRYDSFNISNIDRVQKKIELTDILKNIINTSNIGMMYRDIQILSDLILEYFSIKEYSKDFKILFILKYGETEYCKNIFVKIKINYPNIQIFTDSVLNLRYGKFTDCTLFDLIISEYEDKSLENCSLIGTINLKEVQLILDKYILDKMLIKINNKGGQSN
ncbi:MAG: hypothetical protein ACRCYT_07280, partial [Cetobacterium sp.]